MKEYKINKEKCVSCGACIANCPEAIEIKEDGRVEIVDSEKLVECGWESVCPFNAIEKIV